MYTIIKSSTITNFIASLKADLLSFSSTISLSTILDKLLEKPVDYTRMIQHNPSVIFASVSYIAAYRFEEMEELQKISFPVCTNIQNAAFYSCPNLSYADIGQCSSIGYMAFGYCSSLETIVASGCTYISKEAFYNCVNLSDAQFGAVSYIGGSAFYECSNLRSFDFANINNLSDFDQYAFRGCKKLSSIPNYHLSEIRGFADTALEAVPETVVRVFDRGLQNTSISFIDSSKIIEIGFSGFADCDNLSYISCDNCISIGMSAFRYCDNLQTVYLSKCSIIEECVFEGCKKLSQVVIPECTGLMAEALGWCSSLTQVSFPKCLFLDNMALYSCNLTALELPYCLFFGLSAFDSNPLSLLSLPRAYYGSSFSLNADNVYTPLVTCVSIYKAPSVAFCKEFTFAPWFYDISKIISFLPFKYLSSAASGLPARSLYQYDYHITCYSYNYFSDGTKIYVPSEKYSQALAAVNYSWCKSIISTFTPDFNYIYPYQYESLSIPSDVFSNKIALVENGFNGCNLLDVLTVPSGVCIDNYAFRGANINSIICEDNCILASSAFLSANNIKNLSIGNAITLINTTPGNCIRSCRNLENLNITYPYSNLIGVTDCVNLKTAYLASVNMNSNSTALTGNYNLTMLSIGNNLTQIGSITCQELCALEEFYTLGSLSIQSYTGSKILMPNLRSWYVDSQKVSEYRELLSCYCNSECVVSAVAPISYHSISVFVGSCMYYDTSALACISMNCDLQDLVYSTISYSQDYTKYIRFGSFSMNTTSLPRSITVDLSYLGYQSTFTIVQNPPESSNNYIVDWDWVLDNGFNCMSTGELDHVSGSFSSSQFIVPTAIGRLPVTSIYFYSLTANELSGNSLSGYWFNNCNISKVSFENCDTVYRLTGVSGLKEVHLPNALTINYSAFYSMHSIETLDIPNVETIGSYAFARCYDINFSFPKVKTIGSMAFYNCSRMTTLDLPECTNIEQYAFSAVYTLKYLDLPKCTYIGRYAFAYCTALESLTLRASQIVSISSNIFYQAKSDFSVFVPSSLYSDYLVDSAWSSYSTHIYSY